VLHFASFASLRDNNICLQPCAALGIILIKAKNFIVDVIPAYAGISLITNSYEMSRYIGTGHEKLNRNEYNITLSFAFKIFPEEHKFFCIS